MAYESFYWRKTIKRECTYLRKKMILTHEDVEGKIDEHFSFVEIKIMTIAYILRKMADTQKLPTEALNRHMQVMFYPRNHNVPPRMYVDIEKEYDLSHPDKTSISIRQICNQIIHSYVLQAVGNETFAFKSLWVVSDYEKDNKLFELDLKELIRAAISIANEYPSRVSGHYDEFKGRWIITYE